MKNLHLITYDTWPGSTRYVVLGNEGCLMFQDTVYITFANTDRTVRIWSIYQVTQISYTPIDSFSKSLGLSGRKDQCSYTAVYEPWKRTPAKTGVTYVKGPNYVNVFVGDRLALFSTFKSWWWPTVSNTNALQVSATFNRLNEINSMVHIVHDLNLNLVKSELAPDSLGEPTFNNIVMRVALPL